MKVRAEARGCVEVAKRAVEYLGHRGIIMSSDSEPAILALKEAVRMETDVEIALEAVRCL